jgi:hypothetical protein
MRTITSGGNRRVAAAIAVLMLSGAVATAQNRGRTPRRTPAPAAKQPAVADVKLDALRATVTEPPRVTRNPFRFYQPPPPPPQRVVRPAEPVFVAPPAPTGPPPPPPITLRFIGLIEAPQRSGRVALLSDGRGGLMHGREGDIIEGRYRVLRVGTDSIDLVYADGRGRQTIRLSGQ